MKLKELFPTANFDCEVLGLTQDSQKVQKGFVFFAIKGHTVDGHKFIPAALQNGACAIISQENLPYKEAVLVKDIEQTMADAALKFYDNPSNKLKMFAITGTKGKTSISYLIESILITAGKIPAVLGTINYRINRKVLSKAPNTTPAALTLQNILATAVNEGADSCVMEVSSHALELKRVDGVNFDTAIFTNLQRDHLDFHHTFENYFNAKYKLFDSLLNPKNPKQNKTAIINIDDEYGQKLHKMLEGKIKVLTYSINGAADFAATEIKPSLDGVSFKVNGKNAQINLLGAHNVYNALAAIAAASTYGIDLENSIKGIANLDGVAGRMQAIKTGQPFYVFVDFAYTEEALLRAFDTVKPYKKGKIITVFGCGGERDTTKRPLMGACTVKNSDYVIITNDNPRREDPQNILKDILKGVGENKNYEVELDRRTAINKAIKMANPGDIVLIAGKGHEDYQILPTGKIHFSDEEEALKALKNYV
ncbi:MAG: UDP-N-acetylmuramoyl-L-alanyl-D-glutamate--2,6-diaminopimelate ligase [Elusimicrobiaceae bacterium]|nr:UDP-N-acetylmuramoyl-L-alanyl-D-glutamate--2,6-diaminopimelate ligase [Elusimicrobiaceae bacterium]